MTDPIETQSKHRMQYASSVLDGMAFGLDHSRQIGLRNF